MSAAGIRPGLAVVLVGHNPASESLCPRQGESFRRNRLYSEQHTPGPVSTAQLLDLIADLNRRDEIDGILVQLPLACRSMPSEFCSRWIRREECRRFLHERRPPLNSTPRCRVPPSGVMEILSRGHIPVAGREAVVVGRSDIVGKPVAMLLMNANATVTSATRRLTICQQSAAEQISWSPAIGRRNDHPRFREARRDGNRRGHKQSD